MKKYLDPKADLTFKKIFGEHEDLLISLLNALLPLKEDELVEEVEYLSPELVPDNYVGKNSIVDVRCKDIMGRQFLVEMQMLWTPSSSVCSSMLPRPLSASSTSDAGTSCCSPSIPSIWSTRYL